MVVGDLIYDLFECARVLFRFFWLLESIDNSDANLIVPHIMAHQLEEKRRASKRDVERLNIWRLWNHVIPFRHGQVQKPHQHKQFRKWQRNGLKKHRSQRYKLLKGVDPKFLRNMCCPKKHTKKDLKKMQANNAKAMSSCAEAIKDLVKPKVVKPKTPKCPSCKLTSLTFIALPKLGKRIRGYMVKGRWLFQLKSKV
ncbi:60S ribosomal protein L29-like protein [Cricetulus griseus]|uniref:60S ribosomal protein L29 n=1 Tax=Cricetulus griseus TaxID=10029 RepID=A0A061ID71_CRIGR|nr:60S ribosomal protein L29-like protein [Cricetulus griseus]